MVKTAKKNTKKVSHGKKQDKTQKSNKELIRQCLKETEEKSVSAHGIKSWIKSTHKAEAKKFYFNKALKDLVSLKEITQKKGM
jgi:hypothetical protein